MAELSGFWTTSGTGDGSASGYTLNDWRDIFNNLFAPGQEAQGAVIKGAQNELAVSGAVSPVAVNTGRAIVNGFWYENTTSLNLAITTPAVGTTGFRVVLRASWAAQTVRAAIVKNTDGLSAIPAATQVDGTTWEITLATGTITTAGVITLTDARNYARQDSIDDVMVGNRVPAFMRRQGGASATDWSDSGTTNHTPTTVRMQGGVTNVSAGLPITPSNFGSITITFPIAFGGKPKVQVTNQSAFPAGIVSVQTITTTTALINIYNAGSTNITAMNIAWLAIGPE